MGIAPPPPGDPARLPPIAFVAPGTQLHEGQTYIDLNDLATGPFRARGRIVADEHDRFVPEGGTDRETWRRLVEISEQAGR